MHRCIQVQHVVLEYSGALALHFVELKCYHVCIYMSTYTCFCI